MDLHIFRQQVLNPAFDFLPETMRAPGAFVLLGATALQETKLQTRRQSGGPAVSFFQNEKSSIEEVLTNAKTAYLANAACSFHSTSASVNSVYEKFKDPSGDILAAIFARLNYWAVPKPLPSLAIQTCEFNYWDYYKSTWRPGRPHLETWPMAFWRAYGAYWG